MAREITAGVLLKLKDQLSSQIHGAGISVQGFADKAVGVADRVNRAFSGLAGTLGTLGVSVGALSAVKSTIDLDNRMARLGLTANASAAEVNELKRQIFVTAQMPDIKLDTDSIISALEVVMTKTGDLGFVENNVRNIALAIQASGESGDAMGAVFSEFAKFGYTMEEILPLMNDLIAQGDQGAFTFGEFAKNAPAVFSAYSIIGTTPEHIRKASAAMQILMAGTKSADIAVTVLNSTMAELSDPEKQEKLRMLGIDVRDLATNEFRDFNDIMFDIVAKAEEMGNADFFGTIFGTTSMQAFRAYITQGERMYDNLVNLGDTAGLLEQKSATMADTLKSNLQNLQTAFLSFADKSLTGPLQDLANLLNKLAEDPEKVEDAIRNITLTLGALAAVRVGAGVVSLLASLNSLKGGNLNVSGPANAGGGAGIPVHVTNWGGSGGPPGPSGIPTTPPGGLVDQYGRPLASGAGIPPPPALPATGGRAQQALAAGRTALRSPRTIATGVGAGLAAAWYEIPEMLDTLHDIERDETLTDREKGAAKGGAIGDASGSIVGAAGGAIAGGVLAAMATSALAGTALGTAIPGLGNIAGLIIGAGVGAAGYYFGGKAGRAAGTVIGGAVAGDDESAARSPRIIDPAYNYGGYEYCGYRRPVNDLIVTPQGQFSTHPDDYIFAMKNPAALVNEVRTVERVPPAMPPVVIDGEIQLRSELFIDDKSCRLRQSIGKNTTPYKFAVGSAQNARLIQ
ncbi:MAG: hypothetical protein LBG57_04550 [Treponema sp.]|jgi:hypothetical protein|nr:hypothetical protein [Treponema sp.]